MTTAYFPALAFLDGGRPRPRFGVGERGSESDPVAGSPSGFCFGGRPLPLEDMGFSTAGLVLGRPLFFADVTSLVDGGGSSGAIKLSTS